MTNPFLQYGETLVRSRPKRVKIVKDDSAAPMKKTEQDKAQEDKSIQMQLWRAQWRGQYQRARAGLFGRSIVDLERFLRRMTIDDSAALIDLVKRSGLKSADVNTRWVALRMVTNGIAHVRAVNGYPPFDDSLPGEPPTTFEIIRAELRVP